MCNDGLFAGGEVQEGDDGADAAGYGGLLWVKGGLVGCWLTDCLVEGEMEVGREGGEKVLTPKQLRESARSSLARAFMSSSFLVSSSSWKMACSFCWQKAEMVGSRALVARIQIVWEQSTLLSLDLRRSWYSPGENVSCLQ